MNNPHPTVYKAKDRDPSKITDPLIIEIFGKFNHNAMKMFCMFTPSWAFLVTLVYNLCVNGCRLATEPLFFCAA